ncbi:MAG: MarR family transcriptional regulator [Clostridia bacterium]|nr:MarR family transcriptional regulator [Clostridia bacterium]
MMAIGRIHREWRNHMRKCALEVGIPDSYRMIIMYLSRNPGSSQKELSEFASKTTAAVNQTVKEMQSNGYIRKETDEKDQRYTRLYLTEKGMEKSELLRERLHKSDNIITEKMGFENEEKLIEFLDGMTELIKGGL